MGRQLVLVLGGARSGKSVYAEQRAAEMAGGDGGAVLYVATAEALDEEMAARIRQHRAARPAAWRTLEEPLDVGPAIARARQDETVVLIDCVTLWISNVLLRLPDDESMPLRSDDMARMAVDGLLAAHREGTTSMVLVSNEVGMGIVPAYPLGRVYRDVLGRVNMWLAAEADEVILMVAGLPMRIKPRPDF